MIFFRRNKHKQTQIDQPPKTQKVNTSNLNLLIEHIREVCGVDLISKKETLSQRFILFCQPLGITSFDELISKMKYDSKIKQDVINLITVNETYFYRELPQLNFIINYIKSLNKQVRILSAPCASGEEIYSLAIMAKEANILTNIKLLGIDINSQAIKRCYEGIYSQRSLHRLDLDVMNKYFKKNDEMYEIQKKLLPETKFEVINIFDNSFLSYEPFDIILSRNMMIYFDKTYKLKAVEIFHKLLKKDGKFFAGHADLIPETNFFKKSLKDGVNYYKKV